jgi:hypothetical protein
VSDLILDFAKTIKERIDVLHAETLCCMKDHRVIDAAMTQGTAIGLNEALTSFRDIVLEGKNVRSSSEPDSAGLLDSDDCTSEPDLKEKPIPRGV